MTIKEFLDVGNIVVSDSSILDEIVKDSRLHFEKIGNKSTLVYTEINHTYRYYEFTKELISI